MRATFPQPAALGPLCAPFSAGTRPGRRTLPSFPSSLAGPPLRPAGPRWPLNGRWGLAPSPAARPELPARAAPVSRGGPRWNGGGERRGWRVGLSLLLPANRARLLREVCAMTSLPVPVTPPPRVSQAQDRGIAALLLLPPPAPSAPTPARRADSAGRPLPLPQPQPGGEGVLARWQRRLAGVGLPRGTGSRPGTRR